MNLDYELKIIELFGYGLVKISNKLFIVVDQYKNKIGQIKIDSDIKCRIVSDLINFDSERALNEEKSCYSFYIENTGKDAVDYWTEFIIDDAIKNVDEAIRIRIYFDGKYVDYAKSSITGEAEPGTVKFLSDDVVFQDSIKNFKPDEIHRYTIVIWLEGSDLECTNDILGGEIRAHMNFKSEVRESGEK